MLEVSVIPEKILLMDIRFALSWERHQSEIGVPR